MISESSASTSLDQADLIRSIAALPAGGLIPLPQLEAILQAVTQGAIVAGACGNGALLAALKKRAFAVLKEHRGTGVYYRGLLEFSNLCNRNCDYCGIRAGNTGVERFTVSLDEIAEVAGWCADNGYGSVTLQSGERSDGTFLDFVEAAIRRIKAESQRPDLPEGLGITLCVGELNETALRRMRAAGVHRYLLRVETTNPALYAAIHPHSEGGLDGRVANLRLLQKLGFQVGTGVMIGLPGQSMADLAADLHFFVNERVQMIGMGPYIMHADTPLAQRINSGAAPALLPDRTRFELGLAMVALARIMLPRANIAATTALQALHPFGRELGLDAGANILMPLVTPQHVRANYQLYDGKPCIDDALDECRECLAARVASTKREVGYNQYGDSLIPVRAAGREPAASTEA